MKKSILYVILLALLAPVLTSCDEELAQPPLIYPEGGLGTGVWNDPMKVTQVIAGAEGSSVWLCGYVVGWIDTNISNSYTEETCMFTLPATVASNLLLAAKPDEKNIEKCIPVQLPTGAVRSGLNLVDNPNMLGMMICLKGDCQKYFGRLGFKNATEFTLGDKGTEEAPVQTGTFQLAKQLTDGGTYLMVANSLIAQNITSGYGYFKVEPATITDGIIKTGIEGQTWTFEACEGGYHLRQADGRYIYMKDNYNNFNTSDMANEAGSVFTVSFAADGSVSITNVAKGKTIQFDPSYTSFGAYTDSRGVLPNLYELKSTNK